MAPNQEIWKLSVDGPAPPIKPVAAPWVWTARDLAARTDWIVRLPAAADAEIAAAVEATRRRGLPLLKITRADFPLPETAAALAEVERLITDGPGVAVLRGLPVAGRARDDIDRMLWGIGTHLGRAVAQSYRGDMVGEVMDMTHTGDARRAYRSPLPLDLHIDSADVAALLCLRRAKRGGESLVASSFAIHNAVLAERPDLMPELYRGFHCEHSEADSAGEPPRTAHRVPVFGPVGGRLVCNFHTRPMARAFDAETRRREPQALEAYEAFRAASVRDELVHRMTLEPGDMQILNNRLVLHGRTEFEDFAELDRKRLMLRLWLAMPSWPALPADMHTH